MAARALRYSARPAFGRLVNRAAVVVVLVVVLFPILWMAFASMRPTMETLSDPPVWIPRDVTFAAYWNLFSDPTEVRYFFNTYLIALATAGLSVLLGALSAYGFSRYRIRGARTILLGILGLQLLPNVALVLPFFNMAQALGIHNTYLALIIA